MTLSKDMEILKSIAIVRQENAQIKFKASLKLHCPVCGDECPVFNDILNCRNILYCRACQSDYMMQIRAHLTLPEDYKNYMEGKE